METIQILKNAGQLFFIRYPFMNFKTLTDTQMDVQRYEQTQSNIPPQLFQSWGHKMCVSLKELKAYLYTLVMN